MVITENRSAGRGEDGRGDALLPDELRVKEAEAVAQRW